MTSNSRPGRSTTPTGEFYVGGKRGYAIHSNTTNPVRLVSINTQAGTIDISIVAPWNSATDWASYRQTISGVEWVG